MSGTIKNQPYFSCQNSDCAEEISYPAEMLAVFEGSPICENCYGYIDGPEEGELPEYSDLPDFVPEYEVRYKELCEQFEAKNAELKSVRDENERLMDKIAGLRNDVLEEIENRDAHEERLDKLAYEVARFFGVEIGEHSSANCPWNNAFEAIPTETLISANETLKTALIAEVIPNSLVRQKFNLAIEKGSEIIGYVARNGSDTRICIDGKVQTLDSLKAQWQSEQIGIAAQICDAEASIHNITGHPNSEMMVAIHCAEKIRQLAKESISGK
jgi:hypothetical protein